jgi:hypothetical protein
VCSSGERIEAVFDTGSNRVDLSLPDGRKLSLAQVLSASGARYANADESIVFWNKGRTAFLQESGVVTQSDCRSAPWVAMPRGWARRPGDGGKSDYITRHQGTASMFSERIEEFDAPAYYFRYRVIDIGPLPFVDYVGSIRLALAGPERCVVIYHAEFLPVGGFPPGLGLQMTQQNFQFLVARLRELSSK